MMISDQTLKTLINLKGKHIKQVLQKLESANTHNPVTRKIILDEINDLMRAVLKELGIVEE